MCWEVHQMSKIYCQKYLQNIANVWFQKSRVSSRVFAQSLGLATSIPRLGLEDFGRDTSSGLNVIIFFSIIVCCLVVA